MDYQKTQMPNNYSYGIRFLVYKGDTMDSEVLVDLPGFIPSTVNADEEKLKALLSGLIHVGLDSIQNNGLSTNNRDEEDSETKG